VNLIDRLLLKERNIGRLQYADGVTRALFTPQIQAFLLCVVPPTVLASNLLPMILWNTVADYSWIIGCVVGFSFFLWRVAIVSPLARFDEDETYDNQTRHILSPECKDTYSASHRDEVL
jgi:hypothetical protein